MVTHKTLPRTAGDTDLWCELIRQRSVADSMIRAERTGL